MQHIVKYNKKSGGVRGTEEYASYIRNLILVNNVKEEVALQML